MNNLQQPKNVIKAILIIGLIAFLGFFVHKYLQFRTAFLEKQRVELAQEEKKKQEEAEQKAFTAKRFRCETTKPIMEIAYKDNLLSVNLDCVELDDLLKEISKKIGVEIIHPELVSVRVPLSFNNLPIQEALNTIGKNTGFGVTYIARYLPDKNIWSFDEVFLEVKNPPRDGVAMIIKTKNNYEFLGSNGTVKKESNKLKLFGIEKSNNDEYLVSLKYTSKNNTEFVVLNNQGEEQWKIKTLPGLVFTYIVSNNGKYIVAAGNDNTCDDCHFTSYIVTKEKILQMTRDVNPSSIIFSPDGKFFLSHGDTNTIFDENGDAIKDQKIIDSIVKEINK